MKMKIIIWITSTPLMRHVRLDLLMSAESKNGLEFLDLRLRLKGCTKITVDVYSKPTNSFTYVDLLPL